MTAGASPITLSYAAQGHAWAIKLRDKGWRSLSPAQKKAARAAGIGPQPTPVIVPKVNRLVAGNPTNARRKPTDPGNANTSMTITKQEFLGTLFSGDEISTYILDPRNVKTFPNISNMAIGYNKYKITNAKLRYSSRATDSDCSIIIAYNSDSSDTPPASKLDLYSMATKHEGPSSKPLLMSLPISKETRYLRDRNTDEAKLVDSGSFHILVDGKHDGRLGELFFELTIVLSEPTFLRPASQIITGTSSRGPDIVTVDRGNTSCTIRFNAVGRFIISASGTSIKKLSQVGMEKASLSRTDSDSDSTFIAEVIASEPGASIIVEYPSGGYNQKVYVSRM
uniref:Capsid protein n=2 Tax=TGP Carmovirus 3 TaxID=944582 RepID=F2YS81_9TOMB|nr:putative coat protein [TGP Carmovirus 3]